MNNVFKLNENSNFEFSYKGKNYLISVNINDGLINLREIEENNLKDLQTIFISDIFNETVVEKEEVKKVESKNG